MSGIRQQPQKSAAGPEKNDTGGSAAAMNRLCLGLCGLLVCLHVPAATADTPPNVVLILMDDMGWRDVGFMGNSFTETPHLDRLATRGIVFSQAYASAPNCAPTRACLMSGQYTPRHGIYTVVDPRQPNGSPWHQMLGSESRSELDTGVVTIAESLQTGGYATAFFGMWNLGRGRSGPMTPGGQGFQRVVFPENLNFGKDAYINDRGEYLSDRLMDSVLEFVEQNRERPFFVYLPDHAVHAPWNPKPDLLKKYAAKAEQTAADRRNDPQLAATVEAVDQNVGRLLETLDRLHLTDNTLIIFTSDNGGTNTYTPPLRGGKGALYEGGIRVPLVVAGAGVRSPGRTVDVPVASIDWYPTLLELAGIQAPGQVLDGASLVPLLRGESRLERDRLFWHFPCYVGRNGPASAVRVGNWKLLEFFEEGGRRELYDLAADPSEATDLSDSSPQKLRELTAILDQWQADTQAAIPTAANPDYDPTTARGGGKGGPGGKGGGGGNAGKKGGKAGKGGQGGRAAGMNRSNPPQE
ncbi:MAG: sulfatase [Planctomycetota bacterium]